VGSGPDDLVAISGAPRTSSASPRRPATAATPVSAACPH